MGELRRANVRACFKHDSTNLVYEAGPRFYHDLSIEPRKANL